MLNVESDASQMSGKTHPPPGGQPQVQPQINNLKPEEIKMYKDCVFSMYYKAGIPFAIFCHLLSSRKKSGEVEIVPKNYLRKGFLFFGNILLGSLLFTPMCYYKLVAMRAESDKREREMELQGSTNPIDEVQPGSHQPEDFSYPGDVMTNLNEPESNFSSDFSTSRLLSDDEKDVKIRSTTYDDLRARHRSRYASKTPAPPSALNFESSPGSLSSPLDKPTSSDLPPSAPPQRKVVKNKYGDEIE